MTATIDNRYQFTLFDPAINAADIPHRQWQEIADRYHTEHVYITTRTGYLTWRDDRRETVGRAEVDRLIAANYRVVIADTLD